MKQAFDPYHIWLGIPSEEQPPNHYRLLGVKLFEANLDVIQNAADRQMVHLRTFQTGRHMEFSQRLLNEVAAAKICLLKRDKKATYDEQLRALIEQNPPSTATAHQIEETIDPALTFLAEKSERRFHRTLARPRANQGTRVATMVGASIAAGLLLLGFLAWNSSSHERASSSPKATAGKRIVRPPVVRKEKKVAAPAAKSNDNPPTPMPSEPSAAPPTVFPREPPPIVPAKPPPGANQTKPQKILPTEQPPKWHEATREQLLPVPGDKEQEEAMKRARDLFADECSKAKTVEEKRDVAKKILEKAEKMANAPVGAFVLFRLAHEVSLQAADCETAFWAIDAMAERYRVDAVEMKSDVLKDLAKKARTSFDHALLAEQAMNVIDLAIADDKYSQAVELSKLALAEAVKARDRELLVVVRPRVQEVREAARKHTEFEAVRAVLADKPDDPEANFAAGEYLCFVKGDWEMGLPYLAKGTNAELKALAEREIALPPTKTARKIELADDWWDLAQTAKGSKKDAILLHAGSWYEQARGKATGLVKATIEKRLVETAKIEWAMPSATTDLVSARANIELEPDMAELHGPLIRLGAPTGLQIIGWWKSPQAWASWSKVSFRYPGIYEVSVLATTPNDKSELLVTVGKKKLVGEVSRTGGWGNFQTFTLGKIRVERPGELMVAVRPRDAKTWKPIDLARLTLKIVANNNAAARPRRGRYKAVPGRITASCDDMFELYVNGARILAGHHAGDVPVKDHDFAKGDVIAVKCVNTGGPKGFTGVIQFQKRRMIVTGGGWRAYTPKDITKEWFDSKNIGQTFPVVPGNSQTRNNVLKACGVGAWEIWSSSGDSCYLLYVVP